MKIRSLFKRMLQPARLRPHQIPVQRLQLTPVATQIVTSTISPTHTATATHIVTACIPPATWVSYIVQAGETLAQLAIRHSTTVTNLAIGQLPVRQHHLHGPIAIRPGQCSSNFNTHHHSNPNDYPNGYTHQHIYHRPNRYPNTHPQCHTHADSYPHPYGLLLTDHHAYSHCNPHGHKYTCPVQYAYTDQHAPRAPAHGHG